MKRLFTVLAMISVLSGCVSLSTPELGRQWDGRFSLSVSGNGFNENQTGRFALTRDAAQTTILDLKSAIGTTVARIEQHAHYAQLQAVGVPAQKADDIHALMQSTLGFTVPVDGLEFWLDGQPIPGEPVLATPSTPPYRQLEQNGWQIQFLSYENNAPKRLRLSREASDGAPAISMTLVINSR